MPSSDVEYYRPVSEQALSESLPGMPSVPT